MLCVIQGCGKKAPSNKGPVTFCEEHRFAHRPVFVFQTVRGFGKGWTLKEAVDAYQKHNGEWDTKLPYFLEVFKAEKLEDVGVDLLNWHTSNFAQHIAKG